MGIFSKHPILFLILLLACAVVLMSLGVYGIIAAGRREKEQYVFLSNMAALRRKFSEKQDQENRPWVLIYVGLSLHRLRNTYSQTEVGGVYDYIQQILLLDTYRTPGNLVANCDGKNFMILTHGGEAELERMMGEFFSEVERYASAQGIARLPEVHFGYYAAKSHDVGFDEAVSRAKQAYKYAESTRKNGCVWDYEMLRSEAEVEKLEREISSAIEHDEFFLEFQPFVDARTEQVIGGEVLTRLNLPERSLVGPASFLRAIAGIGLFSRFDYYVFGKCCAWASCQIERNPNIQYLSCNFSRHTISKPDFAKKIIRIADQYGVPHHMFAIEITEEEQEIEMAQAAQNLEDLHQSGFHIFLDDFGCGFTSLDDLQYYWIDVVKVDKSILDRTETEKGRAIFRHVVQMAKDVGCKVLCEGVETREQLELVRQTGCDIVQGYYFYKALPVDKFNALLAPATEAK